MIRLDYGWDLPIKGCEVIVHCDKFSISLLFKKGLNEFTLHIEVPLLILVDGKEVNVNTEDLESQHLLGILAESTVENAVAQDDGALVLSFSGDRSLKIDGSSEFEPWSITGPNDLRIVSTPDRELAIWNA